MPTPEELERMSKDLVEDPEAAKEASRLLEKVATQIRHRNEDLVPGRIVHLVPEQRKECIAAIVVQTFAHYPASAGLRVFNPLEGSAMPDGFYDRDDSGANARRWHYSIACPFKGGVDSG